MPKIIIEIHIKDQFGSKQIAERIKESIVNSMQGIKSNPYIEEFNARVE